MVAFSWIRFEWDLSSLPGDSVQTPQPFVIRGSGKNELSSLTDVAASALAIDVSWGDSLRVIAPQVTREIERIHDRDPENCLVVLHGQRIIGISVVDPASPDERDLTTGPLILHEYRNRGIGSALLGASLARLSQCGLSSASGLARERSIAARFVYPKFGGIGKPLPSGEAAEKQELAA